MRTGAYIAGSRRVSPKERSRWRFTFKRLLAEARETLRAADIDPGVAAMTALVDLACEMRDREYFRSDDPIEAAKVEVSDEVSLLWNRVREHRGFAAFATLSAPQLICWESPYGWSRSGWGPISQKETTLAKVVAAMLPAQDAWATFTDHYLAALAELTPLPPHPARKKEPRVHDHSEWNRKERARNLADGTGGCSTGSLTTRTTGSTGSPPIRPWPVRSSRSCRHSWRTGAAPPTAPASSWRSA